MMSIVGDAYARPLVHELRRRPLRPACLGRGSAPVAPRPATRTSRRWSTCSPTSLVIDGYGASETGGMAFGATNRSMKAAFFAPAAGAAVVSADRTRFVEPGEDEIGWTARRGRVPLGYLDDEQATEATFPIVDGERVAVPGDRARLEADGTIRLLGRDSMVVNTGGEKVFVEEVEQALLRHPDVVDVLVVGRPSPRFGQEVVGVVQLEPGSTATGEELREFCACRWRGSRRPARSCSPTPSPAIRAASPTTDGRSRSRASRGISTRPTSRPSRRTHERATARGSRSARRAARRPAWCRPRPASSRS